jgi:hypothetical protein
VVPALDEARGLADQPHWDRASSDTKTIGGARDSDANALTVVPCGALSNVVTTETGVHTWPMAGMNSSLSASSFTAHVLHAAD